MNDKRILNQNALHQFDTVKPGTINDAHFTINMLIIKRNMPSVKMVIGIVSIIKTGLTKELSKARTTATNIAEVPFFMVTPGNR